MFIRASVLAVGLSALTFGCAIDQGEDETQETIANLIDAGYPASDIQIVDGKVIVGNDAVVSLQASREMLESDSGDEQYRTNNLIGGTGTAIICVNGAAFAGNATLNAGLNQALENYNQLQLAGQSRLFFFRVNGGAIPGCTHFINGVVVGGLVGGSAGFPSGGAPYHTINIGDGIVPYGTDVAEHVITHELGHCIGFRHSDYYNRSISCGLGGDEGDAGVGANHIPNTPTNAVVGGSIMNSCFRASETGEFTGSDITAIDVLY
jgi:hypothetical protein